MARNTDRDRNTSTRRGPKDAGRRIKKKPCALCRDQIAWVDYKDVNMLRKYMSDRGKIRARRVTGNCSQHQRAIALAIRTARELVLLPYTQRTVTERTGGRGRGRDRGERGDRPERDRPMGRPPGRDGAPGATAPDSSDGADRPAAAPSVGEVPAKEAPESPGGDIVEVAAAEETV